MATTVSPDDARITWQGAVSVERTAEWMRPWRIPHEERALFHPEVVNRARMPAGVRIAFTSDTREVAGEVKTDPDTHRIDLVCDGALAGSEELAGRDRFAFTDLPEGEKAIELWLPQTGEFRLKSLSLSDGASLAPVEETRPKWVTYGSSITQCGAAASPTETWPAIVARGRGLDLTCLGFGGNCHLEPMVARVMRDVPADCISICVGINIYGGATLSPRTFREGIIGFVKIVRERHEGKPFVVMSPIFSPPREDARNAVGFTLKEMRSQVEAAVDALRRSGDPDVHYVDGLDVLGPDLAHLLPDELHPDAEGYRALGASFRDKVAARYFA